MRLKSYKVFMNFELPTHIRPAMEGRILEKYPLNALIKAAEEVSSRYRREDGRSNFQIKSEVEALSYLASRVPATYAANARVMAEIRKHCSDFSPKSILDIGAGPATACVAAGQYFETIETSRLIEPNVYLSKAGQEFFAPYLRGAEWQAKNIETASFDKSFDIVIASYVLNEVAKNKLDGLIKKCWDACSGMMVIIEPGTPQGASIIQQVREFAVDRKINILAPCPHAGECPLKDTSSRWCHFAVRTSRSKLHKTLKGGDAGFEDEKFSYIVLSRHPSTPPSHRLIGYPSGTKLRELQVCSPKGAETLQVSKSHPLHKLSKKLEWGDGFDIS
jgi:ribosomal protein RSM22 (predicted rRNA methylase)